MEQTKTINFEWFQVFLEQIISELENQEYEDEFKNSIKNILEKFNNSEEQNQQILEILENIFVNFIQEQAFFLIINEIIKVIKSEDFLNLVENLFYRVIIDFDENDQQNSENEKEILLKILMYIFNAGKNLYNFDNDIQEFFKRFQYNDEEINFSWFYKNSLSELTAQDDPIIRLLLIKSQLEEIRSSIISLLEKNKNLNINTLIDNFQEKIEELKSLIQNNQSIISKLEQNMKNQFKKEIKFSLHLFKNRQFLESQQNNKVKQETIELNKNWFFKKSIQHKQSNSSLRDYVFQQIETKSANQIIPKKNIFRSTNNFQENFVFKNDFNFSNEINDPKNTLSKHCDSIEQNILINKTKFQTQNEIKDNKIHRRRNTFQNQINKNEFQDFQDFDKSNTSQNQSNQKFLGTFSNQKQFQFRMAFENNQQKQDINPGLRYSNTLKNSISQQKRQRSTNVQLKLKTSKVEFNKSLEQDQNRRNILKQSLSQSFHNYQSKSITNKNSTPRNLNQQKFQNKLISEKNDLKSPKFPQFEQNDEIQENFLTNEDSQKIIEQYNFEDFQAKSEYFSKVFDRQTPTPFDDDQKMNFKKTKEINEETIIQPFQKEDNQQYLIQQRINHDQKQELLQLKELCKDKLKEQENFWKNLVNEICQKNQEQVQKLKIKCEKDLHYYQNEDFLKNQKNEFLLNDIEKLKFEKKQFLKREQQMIEELKQQQEFSQVLKNENLKLQQNIQNQEQQNQKLQEEYQTLMETKESDLNQNLFLKNKIEILEKENLQQNEVILSKEQEIKKIQYNMKQQNKKQDEKQEKLQNLKTQIQSYLKEQIKNIKDRISFTKDEFSNIILILKDEIQNLNEKIYKKIGIQELHESASKNLSLLNQTLNQRLNSLQQENNDLRENLLKQEKGQNQIEYSSNFLIIRQKIKIIKQNSEIAFQQLFDAIIDIKKIFRLKKYDKQLKNVLQEKIFKLQLENHKHQSETQNLNQKITFLERDQISNKSIIKDLKQIQKNLNQKILNLSQEQIKNKHCSQQKYYEEIQVFKMENQALRKINDQLMEENFESKKQLINHNSNDNQQQLQKIVQQLDEENQFLNQNNQILLKQYNEKQQLKKSISVKNSKRQKSLNQKNSYIKEDLNSFIKPLSKTVFLHNEKENFQQSQKNTKKKQLDLLGRFNILWDSKNLFKEQEKFDFEKYLKKFSEKQIIKNLTLNQYIICDIQGLVIQCKENIFYYKNSIQINLNVYFSNKSQYTLFLTNVQLINNQRNVNILQKKQFEQIQEIRPFQFQEIYYEIQIQKNFEINPGFFYFNFCLLDEFLKNDYLKNFDPLLLTDLQKSILLPINLLKIFEYQKIEKSIFQLRKELGQKKTYDFQLQDDQENLLKIFPNIELIIADIINKYYSVKIITLFGQVILEFQIKQNNQTIMNLYSTIEEENLERIFKLIKIAIEGKIKIQQIKQINFQQKYFLFQF